MKMKIVMIAWGLLACTGLFGGLCGHVAAGDDLVRMDTSAFEHLKRPAALFDHDTHNELAKIEDCAVCHHVWENGKLVPDESSEDTPCSDCHGLAPGPDNPVPLINAFHTQCKGCHEKQKKGPLLCGQCHKKP